MFSRFFIHRPIFAWVISILIMTLGILAIKFLPVEQFPDVAPPSISINATYTGASAETLENSVTQVIEQQLTGLDNLLYFTSSSSSQGNVTVTVTFNQGTDPDTAQVQVQNKVQQALSRLPSEVQQLGVTVTKSQSNFLLIMGIYDKSNRQTSGDIGDWLVSNLQEPLARTEGVGDIQVFGGQYAMRIWLDPVKLNAFNFQPSDVTLAVQAQNIQVSAGKIGGLPSAENQQLTATVRAQSRLQTPDEFRNIIVKSMPNGATVKVGDVARVEIGSESYDMTTRLNGHPATGMGIMLAPGANALETANLVKHKVEEYRHMMPENYDVAYALDSSEFIKLSVEDVIITLIEAVALVIVVMYLFLQNIRATLIPALAVPVVLLGTFGILSLFGYTINTLTLFAMVLAIGLLVDDAIVVVENVERIMHDEGLSSRDATIKSMGEISGALVAIALVLSVVFLPMAFFAGSTGVIYRQFSVTIISAMTLSVIVALTLTPALCGLFLKRSNPHKKGFFGGFNRFYSALEIRYSLGIVRILRRPALMGLVYTAIGAVLLVTFNRLPGSFLPTEDQGSIMLQATLPSGATAGRTEKVNQKVIDWFLNEEKNNVDIVFTITGFNFSGAAQNAGMAFVKLKSWSERKGSENSADAIAMRATLGLSSIQDAQIFALTPPPVPGLGQNTGFTYELQASGSTTRSELEHLRDELLNLAGSKPELEAVRANTLPSTPQLLVDIDANKAVALGLSLENVTSTLTAAWGGAYVNDFIDRGRVKRVYIQGDQQFRALPSDLGQWYIRNAEDTMTPFTEFATTSWSVGPETLNRFNGAASFEIQGQNAEGFSSGDAIRTIEQLVNELPGGVTGAWSGLSLQEKQAAGQAVMLYALSILVVFLCLAALYESWSIPFSVLLAIPLGVVGTILAIAVRGLSNDIYFQVALLTTVGLTSKNAILIVEFAEDRVRQGHTLSAAALQAAQTRLRPIMMTSLAFIAGDSAGYCFWRRSKQSNCNWYRHYRWHICRHCSRSFLCTLVFRDGKSSLPAQSKEQQGYRLWERRVI